MGKTFAEKLLARKSGLEAVSARKFISLLQQQLPCVLFLEKSEILERISKNQ
ncbi:MAG: hypothetical protein MJE63_12020 [Proteobacteria bacterium]|nr:hypothetical protein [Pseudomonadota bacterium]